MWNSVPTPQLADDDLKELGISSLGHRKKILGSIEALEHEDPTYTRFAKPEDAVERRPLTIMFTDLVDSTAMSLKINAEISVKLSQTTKLVVLK